MPPAESVLYSWAFQPVPAAGLLVAAVLYSRGWTRLHRQVPRRFPVERLVSFLAGLAVIYIALASPLDAFAGWLLVIHMVQHLLLTMVAPPLLLLGFPTLPILSGLPRGFVRNAIGPFLNAPVVHRIGSFFVHPLVAGPLFILSNVAWHVPALYDLALSSPLWHQLEHLCFLGTAVLFWWPVVQPWPSRPQVPRWAIIPYLLAADLQNTALAGFLSFYEGVLYATYANAPRISGLSAQADQAGAGAVMWVPGSIAFLAPVGIIAMSYLSPKRPDHADPPPRPAAKPLSPRRPFDLLKVPVVGAVVRSLAFRRFVQTLVFAVAIVAILDGWFGPQIAEMNLAGVVPWTHWRGFTVLGLLVVGNLFCMACPFTFVRDLVRRWLPVCFDWPKALRTKWLPVGLLVAFFWAYEFFDLWKDPRATAWIVVAYFAGILVIDGLFRGASFCKFVCPIGQFNFVSSLASPAEVKVRDADVCASCRTKDCLVGNELQRGCELELLQPRKSGNMDCTFCLDCVRACPHDNVGILASNPRADLVGDPARSSVGRFANRPDLAVMVGVITAAAFLNAGAMTRSAVQFQTWMEASLGIAVSAVLSSIAFVVLLVALPWGLASGAARVASLWTGVKVSLRAEVSSSLVLFAPLGFAMWLAHFVFHFLSGFFSVWPVVERIRSDVAGTPPPSDWLPGSLAFAGLPALQILFLNAGFLLTLWLLWRKSENLASTSSVRFFLPWAVLAAAVYVTGVWILFQPMEMRGLAM